MRQRLRNKSRTCLSLVALTLVFNLLISLDGSNASPCTKAPDRPIISFSYSGINEPGVVNISPALTGDQAESLQASYAYLEADKTSWSSFSPISGNGLSLTWDSKELSQINPSRIIVSAYAVNSCGNSEAFPPSTGYLYKFNLIQDGVVFAVKTSKGTYNNQYDLAMGTPISGDVIESIPADFGFSFSTGTEINGNSKTPEVCGTQSGQQESNSLYFVKILAFKTGRCEVEVLSGSNKLKLTQPLSIRFNFTKGRQFHYIEYPDFRESAVVGDDVGITLSVGPDSQNLGVRSRISSLTPKFCTLRIDSYGKSLGLNSYFLRFNKNGQCKVKIVAPETNLYSGEIITRTFIPINAKPTSFYQKIAGGLCNKFSGSIVEVVKLARKKVGDYLTECPPGFKALN